MDVTLNTKVLDFTTENKCQLCTTSICCTYITQGMETPKSKHDFRHLLWQLAHKNVEAFKDDTGWFLLFRTTCTHLQPNGFCGIYEDRPDVCREYENDFCEYDEKAEDNFELFFDGYHSLLAYCKKRFKKW